MLNFWDAFTLHTLVEKTTDHSRELDEEEKAAFLKKRNRLFNCCLGQVLYFALVLLAIPIIIAFRFKSSIGFLAAWGATFIFVVVRYIKNRKIEDKMLHDMGITLQGGNPAK
jgi:hypothetical protein